MIFDDVAEIMNSKSVGEIQRKTGLHRDRIYTLRGGCSFRLDYGLLTALNRMGYNIKVEKVSGKPDS